MSATFAAPSPATDRRPPYLRHADGRRHLALVRAAVVEASTVGPVLAAEQGSEYVPDEPPATEPNVGSDQPDPIDRLDDVVAAIGSVDLAELSDRHLDVHLQRLRRPIAALEAARARALAEVERRASSTEDTARRNAEILESRRRAAKGQRMTPSEAKQTAEAGRHADRLPETGRAFGDGDIGPAHVRLIGEALEKLPVELRADAELELLERARSADAIAFGRAVRELLARQAPVAAHREERRRDRDRRFRMTDTADGGVAFSGLAFGAAAELARTALQAFRRPDTPDEHRNPDQRSADAFEQLCAAALRLGEAPTVHGERPQVIVIVEEAQLGAAAGVAHFAGSGQPVTLAEVGCLLTDCSVSRVVRSADGTPIEVSRDVRTVPAGLWRALVVRDGGCRWEGCDAPASWCDVAHGRDAFCEGGRLSPANAVLLCRRHHRRFDHGPWRLEIVGDQVTFHREVVPYVHPLDRSPSDEADRERAGPAPPDGADSDRTGRAPPDGGDSERTGPAPPDGDDQGEPSPDQQVGEGVRGSPTEASDGDAGEGERADPDDPPMLDPPPQLPFDEG
jgi:hypothetical protein